MAEQCGDVVVSGCPQETLDRSGEGSLDEEHAAPLEPVDQRGPASVELSLRGTVALTDRRARRRAFEGLGHAQIVWASSSNAAAS